MATKINYTLPDTEESPILLSDSPLVIGVKRQVADFNFHWFRRTRQIIIDCYVSWYKETAPGVYQNVDNTENGLVPFIKKLVAGNKWVDSRPMAQGGGRPWSDQEVATHKALIDDINNYNKLKEEYDEAVQDHENWEEADPQTRGEEPEVPMEPTPAGPLPSVMPIQEYDYFRRIIGSQPVLVPDFLKMIIQARDNDPRGSRFNIKD